MRSNISYRPYANVDYEKIYKKVVEMDPSMEEFIDEVREIEYHRCNFGSAYRACCGSKQLQY